MSEYKIQPNLFALTEMDAMRSHLEKMAQKGWLLVRAGPYVWRYQRCAPKSVRFHIAYFPKDSIYDPEDTPEKRTYRKASEDAGWKYVSGYDCLQIFSAEEDAAPLEVDALTQVESINSCFKKRERFLWLFIGGFSLLILLIAVFSYVADPVEILSNGAWQLGVLSVLVLVALIVFEAIRYYVWLRNARIQSVTDGSFQPLKKILVLECVVVGVALALFGARIWIQSPYARLVSIADLISYVVIFAAAAITRRIKRKNSGDKKSNFVTTVSVVLLVALVMGMLQDLALQSFRPKYQESDMLISIAELTQSDKENAYYSEEIQRSLLLEDITQYQSLDVESTEALSLQYRITKIKLPSLKEMCRDNCLPAEFHEKLQTLDAAQWSADQVWLNQTKSGKSVFYLYYADRTVTLMVNWELTAQQIEMLAATFQSA